jgi:hypothetical protein
MGTWRADANGNFEIRRVVPRTYTLHATNPAAGTVASIARQEVTVGDRDVTGLELVIGPPLSLSGRLVVEGPLGETPGPFPAFSLTPIDEVPSPDLGQVQGYRTGVRPDGTFTFDAIEPNVFRIETAGLPENVYLRSARLGRRNVLETGIDLRGPTTDSLELTFAADVGSVQGVVTDQDLRPIPGSQVVLIPASRSRFEFFRTATTDQAGRFTIANTPPGEYKLLGLEDLAPGAYFDPAWLAQFESQGAVVHVLPNGHATQNVQNVEALR